MNAKYLKSPFSWIALCSPLFLWGIILLLPTFDDWTYFTTPYYEFGENFTDRLIPRYTYWRPWDGIFGYILSLKPSLFPTLNHIFVYIGHLGGTIFVYKICKLLLFNQVACNISTLFFFISPAMLGTVLGIDSLNQTYAEFWGLLATWFYLNKRNNIHITAWLVCTIISIFAKENGIVFFIIPQILAWGFNKISLRQAIKDSILAFACIAIYFVCRIALYTPEVEINDEYFDNSLFRKLKNIGVFIGMTWIPVDYVSLIHKPSRNLLLVVLTLILGMPFILYIFIKQRRYLVNKNGLCICIAIIAAASPHLVTLFTAMHPYASLGMAALLMGYLANQLKDYKYAQLLFAVFIINCIFVDWHHWQKSYESGLIGDNMAQEVISKAKNRPKKVYIIHLDRGETKYSSFCVIPYDAFGWGIAARFKANNQWAQEITDTNVVSNDLTNLKNYLPKTKTYDGVWYVHGDTVDVIR